MYADGFLLIACDAAGRLHMFMLEAGRLRIEVFMDTPAFMDEDLVIDADGFLHVAHCRLALESFGMSIVEPAY